MGISLKDIASQRAMLERGEEKRKADWKQAERERLRNTFAAAALTGLLSNVQRYQLGPLTEQAFQIADEMIKQSSRAADDREMASEFQKFVQEERKKMDDDPLDYKRQVLTEDGTRQGLVADVATLRDLLVRLA